MGYSIEYDEIYNRTSMTRADMPVKLPAAFTNDPAYNAANRLTTFNSNSVGHDENGNMTGWGSTAYTWDEFNRLTAINGTSLDASYKYDALGRRTAKIINGTTTKYLYDGADIVLEMNENDAATIYYIRTLNIDEPLARIELDSGGNVTGIRFYLADALGSIIALTDENGDIKTRYNYTPFGEPEVIGEESDNPFQFAGRENDEGTGLLFERNRYYSWELGRYISEDPIRFAGGDINFYVRVGNNPVNFTDPLGLGAGIVTDSIVLLVPTFPNPQAVKACADLVLEDENVCTYKQAEEACRKCAKAANPDGSPKVWSTNPLYLVCIDSWCNVQEEKGKHWPQCFSNIN